MQQHTFSNKNDIILYSSVEHGYFEGALESGLRAVANVFRRIDHTYYARFESFQLHGTQDRAIIRGIMLEEDKRSREDTSPTRSLVKRAKSFDVDDLLDFSSSEPMGNDPSVSQHEHDMSAPHLDLSDCSAKEQNVNSGLDLPIELKRLDHYTLICDDAKRVANFHVSVLGFKFIRIQEVNTGTVPPGEVDMLNYVLSPPGNPDITMVVTEGLNDDTIFRKYMKKFGHGIHHVAFEVENVSLAFATIRSHGIKTTAPKVTTDMLSGLKQFFIEPCHAGFFIELIERPKSSDETELLGEEVESGFFTHDNMADLARSIAPHVSSSPTATPETSDDSESSISSVSTISEGKEEEEGPACTLVESPKQDLSRLKIGGIGAFTFLVKQAKESVMFLTKFFNFRQITSEEGRRIHLTLPGQDIAFILQTGVNEERRATVSFAVADLSALPSPSMENGKIGPFKVSDEHASYEITLMPGTELSAMSRVVRSSGMDLHVNIACDQERLLKFLEAPSNLPRWTGHRAIHYSKSKKTWVETRMDSTGKLRDFILVVERMGNSFIKFEWPERNVSILFDCLQRGDGACSLITKFPVTLSKGQLARIKKVLSLELDVLKALMEGNAASCIPAHFWQQIQAYHFISNGVPVKKTFCTDVVREVGFVGDIVQEGPLFQFMSTDFAKTIHSSPHAILRPAGLPDVCAAVKAASALDLKLSARGSQVSHSAGGQAQADGGLLLDMSCLCGVQLSDDKLSIHVQAGTMWDEVIRETLKVGLIPPVINDYQYLSVGGTLSMGGVGFMSHYQGIQAGFVNKLEVVTGLGDVVICSEKHNKPLFDRARGGLGQFGIITSAEIPLVQAPKRLQTFKCFYRHTDSVRFTKDVDMVLKDGRIEMVHSFLKPCVSVPKIAGEKAFAGASQDFRSAMEAGTRNGEVVFFLELAVYLFDKPSDDGLVENIGALLRERLGCLESEIFSENLDFCEYIHCDPPVVETNKEHGSIPHPSLATIISREGAMQLIEEHLASPNRGDDRHNEILLMPMQSNASLGTGSHVPMFPMPEDVKNDWSFFMLVLGSVLPGEKAESDMAKLRAHHRGLFASSQSLGGKRYSYDTLTNDVRGEAAWKKHYGPVEWERICSAKKLYDPFHTLSPGVAMWD